MRCTVVLTLICQILIFYFFNIILVFAAGPAGKKMAIFLVDLQFREKAKQMLSSREMVAVVLFLMFALLPWVEILETAQVNT